MKKHILILICFTFLVSVSPVSAQSREVLGWLEMIRVYPGNMKLRAKMDTGAKSSAINAYDLKKFERDKETWVSFELRDHSKKAKPKTILLEKKVIDSVKIKRKGGGLEERLVVNMEICLGGIHKEIRMSLIDRSNFNYQVLIGRTDLENDFIIDPSATFTHKPLCRVPVQMDRQ
ncbi:MAG: RimK/LysX family protein [Proteobacteria bacterium]|nr:RimK/LysX family protein [Pseudomonadota bacterium]MBU1386486.1 RimK/LysX family protein [Pseudomonadota bacterium]MBU1544597.1 RimK/LysX family protein [Pseudomonadota bacterium]MBU2481192.1 RimK/LysX family protein [Pseudomonadota bacterium]